MRHTSMWRRLRATASRSPVTRTLAMRSWIPSREAAGVSGPDETPIPVSRRNHRILEILRPRTRHGRKNRGVASQRLKRRRLRTGCAALATGAALALATAAPTPAEPEQAWPALAAFEPHPSNWAPDYTVFPYNLWQIRVTPQQIDAQREACQWFNALYGTLFDQIVRFQRFLDDNGDHCHVPACRPPAMPSAPTSTGPRPSSTRAPRPSTSRTTRTRASIRRCSTATRSITCGISSRRSA
ncbi:hypothetical protein MSMEI_2276 [Mycolicibacterium smegmatis MC2 155]|uniref:Uncharacterized protein n=1 Tax=Mycolicibacterium smegmatis (strain ATCC 700084 / mc(2)155) TaxID=246196 RepID=I7G693_MYCS2|nr:hypothetical protein MSMEI_2276 [Mycolicibacterium smegmatis MC2 155]